MVFGLATLAAFLSKVWWVLELPSHFRPHLAAAFAVLTLIWVLKRRWRWASACAAGAGLNSILVLAVLLPAEKTAEAAGSNFRLASINVYTANLQTDLVLEFLRKADADVILLTEVNHRWITAMEPLRKEYPNLIAEPRDDNFGIALYSRHDFVSGEVISLIPGSVPSIAVTLEIKGQQIFILGTHPLPPGSADYARRRNRQLKEISVTVRKRAEPAIVIGDLNITPWSPYFSELLQESGLRNSCRSKSLNGSWPAWMPFGRIPLDHCLVSSNFAVLGQTLGPDVGSDHLPLVVDLQIPDARAR